MFNFKGCDLESMLADLCLKASIKIVLAPSRLIRGGGKPVNFAHLLLPVYVCLPITVPLATPFMACALGLRAYRQRQVFKTSQTGNP